MKPRSSSAGLWISYHTIVSYQTVPAMDPGTIIAVVEASSRVLSLIAKYYSGVKKAKEDIKSLEAEVETLHRVLQKIQELFQSSNAAKLSLLASLATAIEGSSSDIENIRNKLESTREKKAMSRVGLRALKWPLTKKEVEGYVANLERHMKTLTLALSLDQTYDRRFTYIYCLALHS